MYRHFLNSNSSPILELSIKFSTQIYHKNINKPLDGAYLVDFGISTLHTGYQFKRKEVKLKGLWFCSIGRIDNKGTKRILACSDVKNEFQFGWKTNWIVLDFRVLHICIFLSVDSCKLSSLFVCTLWSLL